MANGCPNEEMKEPGSTYLAPESTLVIPQKSFADLVHLYSPPEGSESETFWEFQFKLNFEEKEDPPLVINVPAMFDPNGNNLKSLTN